jgi:hypothetical protein
MKPYLMLLVTLTQVGCSGYSSHFDCPYGDGVGCASLSKVNLMLDQQMIDTSDTLPSVGNKRQIHVHYGNDRMDRILTINDGADL